MGNTNLIIQSGVLIRDPEVKVSQTTKKKYCILKLAVNEGSGESKISTFHTIRCYKKIGELCSEHLKKGRKILVTGKYRENEYEENGQKKYFSYIFAESVEFLDRPTEKEEATF